jgi:RNA-dependent RNA polymerase
LGGGDLDGDVYNLIPLTKLPGFNPIRTYPASEYDPAPKKFLDHPSIMEDVAGFVMEYINSDVSISIHLSIFQLTHFFTRFSESSL